MDIAVINLILGAILLLLGRKLFWFFVGVAGFMIGMDLANRYFQGTDATKLLIALLVWIIGAFLAIAFYKVAVAIAGFLIGGYLAVHLVSYLGISVQASISWVPYLIGGVIGAVLILVLFDWALIILSSLAGASMIVHSITIRQLNMAIAFAVLVIIGILVQAGILLHSRPHAV